MAKANNNKKYPEANRQPRHEAADRIGRAQARQEAYDALTLEQKIAQLPPEPHAKKQRARLMALLAKSNEPKQESALEKGELQFIGADTSPKQKSSNNQKKYMKGAIQQ